MELVSSLMANKTRMTSRFGSSPCCLLFEGTPPTSLEDMPFDPMNFRDAIMSAVLKLNLYWNEIDDNVNNKVIVEHNVVNDSLGVVDFRSGSASAIAYNQIVPRAYCEDGDHRTFYSLLSRQGAFIPKNITSSNKNEYFYFSNYFWTYLEFDKVVSLHALNINFGEGTGYEYFEMEYFDEDLQRWVDMTDPTSEEGYPNVAYNGNNSNHYSVSNTDVYVYSWKPNWYWRYKYWYVREFRIAASPNTKRVRIRTGNIRETRNYEEHYHETQTAARISFSTTTNISELKGPKEITPTWGITYGSGPNIEGHTANDFYVFTVGTENADMIISQPTFSPKSIDIDEFFGPLRIELGHLTGDDS